MKKIIFGIFAHPDDEAFGPSGTLLLETRNNTDLHLITLTNGDAGTNPDQYKNLGEVRLEEWHQAGKLLGAKSMKYLGYKDGELNNQTMILIAQEIENYILSVLSESPNDTIIELMSLDMNGLTGHIDHIVAARATCLAFYRLKEKDNRLQRIRLYCLSDTTSPSSNIDWIYAEPGHPAKEIDEVVDARHIQKDILEVMRSHHTQRSDCEANIKSQGQNLGLNNFIIKY